MRPQTQMRQNHQRTRNFSSTLVSTYSHANLHTHTHTRLTLSMSAMCPIAATYGIPITALCSIRTSRQHTYTRAERIVS